MNMMASITPFLPRFNFIHLLATLVFCLATSAHAETGIQVKAAELSMVDEAYLLKADFEVNFSPALEDALNKGVPLNFVIEFEINRPRWYWLDEAVTNAQYTFRISYHALTKQYRLQQKEKQDVFTSLAELKAVMAQIREWRVMERAQLKKTNYEARLRMKLDLSLLPKPLQVNALTSKDWSMDSDWFRFSLTP